MPTTPTSDTPHLWEPEHPYYAQAGNYYSNDCHIEFHSWESFVEDEGDSDLDMNLLYRWDWDKKEKTLKLYFVGQRKALARSVYVRAMHPDEEPGVRAWLTMRWEHMQKLWAPLSTLSR